MKRTTILLSAFLLVGVAEAGQHSSQAMVAKTTIKAFGGKLKGELQKAMKAGGPLNAISVCNTKAPDNCSESGGQDHAPPG